jgi:hypothetical protein
MIQPKRDWKYPPNLSTTKPKWRDYLPLRWRWMDTDRMMDMPDRWWAVQLSYLYALAAAIVIAMLYALAVHFSR